MHQKTDTTFGGALRYPIWDLGARLYGVGEV